MSEQRPLVSIVVPVYNAEEYLEESLRSIVGQTYPRTEVFVADDASSDGSLSVARTFGDSVRILPREENLGQFENVADAIRRAEGDFVCVFHADDVYHSEIVEREVAYLGDHPDIGAVFPLDVFVDAAGREYGRLELPGDVPARTPLDERDLLRALMVHKNRFLRTPGAMVRTPLYAEAGPFRSERFGHAADLDMWLRIARIRPVAILDRHLFRYRHSADSAAHSYMRERSEVDVFFRLVETHLEETGYDPPPEAVAAFRSLREEDRLLVAAMDYVRGERRQMRERLGETSLRDLWGSGRVRRPRLTVLYLMLWTAARMPRVEGLARAFRARWGGSPTLGGGT